MFFQNMISVAQARYSPTLESIRHDSFGKSLYIFFLVYNGFCVNNVFVISFILWCLIPEILGSYQDTIDSIAQEVELSKEYLGCEVAEELFNV